VLRRRVEHFRDLFHVAVLSQSPAEDPHEAVFVRGGKTRRRETEQQEQHEPRARRAFARNELVWGDRLVGKAQSGFFFRHNRIKAEKPACAKSRSNGADQTVQRSRRAKTTPPANHIAPPTPANTAKSRQGQLPSASTLIGR